MQPKHWLEGIRTTFLLRRRYRKNTNRRRPAWACLFAPLPCEILEARMLLAVDFGDAPDTGAGTGAGNYNTISADNGPQHTIVAGLKMGATVDGELEGLPNATANGDDVFQDPDDEDGLNNPLVDLTLTAGAVPMVNVIVTNTTGSPATLSGWIDYNNNGVFENATERAQVAVADGSNNVIKKLTFPAVPFGFTGKTYARFRLGTTATAQNPTGLATNGEVEDYVARITLPSDSTVQSNVKISDGLAGFTPSGLDAHDLFGSALASLGDLDGDGVTDLAVGAYFDENTEAFEGAVYVLNLALKQIVVTNTSDSGAGSLRQAIQKANATSGIDLIRFSILGAGPHTISPTSALPTITDRVIIDGTSEPDFVPGGPPVVELNGTNAGALANGLKITAGGSTVKGLAINRFLGHGIELRTGGGNVIERNFIGTSIDGTADQGNALDGVFIVNSAGNTIGGTTAVKRNVISGNNEHGVEIFNSPSTDNVVQGNFIGTNAAGTGALGNSLSGVLISGASSNSIGGTAAGAGNTIAFNIQNGVRVTGIATSNRILRNSIFTNTGIGIDLNGDGVTANDADDPDTGPNHRQNFPVLTSAVKSGSKLTITYSVPSIAPNSTFPLRVEFFIGDAAGQEGQTFLGSHSYTTPGAKTVTISAGAAVLGTKIVATTTDTDGNGNTSEFSASRTVASSLLAPEEAPPLGKITSSLNSRQLLPIVNSAITRLSAEGLTSTQVRQLKSVRIDIADLPGATLGVATPGVITLDANAAGYGWFIDRTPFDDAEFSNPKSRISNLQSIDLLTAVMHEFGHLLGHDDSQLFHRHDVMSATLVPGVRRTEFANAFDNFPVAQGRSTSTIGSVPTVRTGPTVHGIVDVLPDQHRNDARRKTFRQLSRSQVIGKAITEKDLDHLFTTIETWL